MKIFEPDEIPIVSWVPAKEAASRINDLEAENQRLRDAIDPLMEEVSAILNSYLVKDVSALRKAYCKVQALEKEI